MLGVVLRKKNKKIMTRMKKKKTQVEKCLGCSIGQVEEWK